MALTINPDEWRSWIVNMMQPLNDVFNQGFVQLDTGADIPAKGIVGQIPVLHSLADDADDEAIAAGTTVTPTGFTDHSEVFPIVYRGKGWTIDNVTQSTSGNNPLASTQGQIALYFTRQNQKKIVAMINGLFAANGALVATHQSDKSAEADPSIQYNGGQYIVDASESILGEQWQDVDTIICHSKVASMLIKGGLTGTMQSLIFRDNAIQTGNVTTFLGKKVVINNTLCAPTGNVYPTYITVGQPVYVGFRKQLDVFPYFNPAVGGGSNQIFCYTSYGVGMRGVTWSAGTYNPSTANLSTAGNWTKVAQSVKDIKLIQLKTTEV